MVFQSLPMGDIPRHVTNSSELLLYMGSHVNLKAALCVTCTGTTVNLLCNPHAKFPWASTLFCINCSLLWTICNQCPNHRSKVTKQYMINKHNKLYRPCNTIMCPDQVSDLNDTGLPLDCPQMPDPCEVQFTLEQYHFLLNIKKIIHLQTYQWKKEWFKSQ